MRKLISLAARAYVVVCLLSAPVFLWGVGWGYKMIFEQSPIAFGIICLATINISLGVAMLIDSRQQHQNPPQDAR